MLPLTGAVTKIDASLPEHVESRYGVCEPIDRLPLNSPPATESPRYQCALQSPMSSDGAGRAASLSSLSFPTSPIRDKRVRPSSARLHGRHCRNCAEILQLARRCSCEQQSSRRRAQSTHSGADRIRCPYSSSWYLRSRSRPGTRRPDAAWTMRTSNPYLI